MFHHDRHCESRLSPANLGGNFRQQSRCRGFHGLGILLAMQAVLPLSSVAEIQTMSSGEMTETYVKDSTIIVTPAKEEEKPKQVVTYTITPGEPVKTEAEIQSEMESSLNQSRDAIDAANQAAFEVDDKFASTPAPQVEFPPLIPRDIPFGIEIPEGPFTFQDILGQTGTSSLPYGDQLNFGSADGQQFVLTIGNIPGYDPVNLDQSYKGQFLELQPRDTGGFDIILTRPPN